METNSLSSTDRKVPLSFYPLLYIIPPQQRPPSPTAYSPSPYVLNHKRRNPVQSRIAGTEATVGTISDGIQQNIASQNSANLREKHQAEGLTPVSTLGLNSEKLTEDSQASFNATLAEDQSSALLSAGEKWFRDSVAKIQGQQTENEVFEIEILPGDQIENSNHIQVPASGVSGQIGTLPTQKSSENEADGTDKDQSPRVVPGGSDRACSSASLQSEEFFDAPDAPFDVSDLKSDDDSVFSNSTTRSPIKSGSLMNARLQIEVARRIQAEKALTAFQLKWNEMAGRYSLVGSSVSTVPSQVGSPKDGQQADPSEILSEKLLIARFVAGAIASAAVRAVKEEELETLVTAKNREISRLRDKLQYYELVNHEMSQRNQEAIEISQRRRRRHRKRVRWAVGCFGALVGIGSTGLLCYKFISWERDRNVQVNN